MAKTWTLNDLGDTMDNVGKLYLADMLRRQPAMPAMEALEVITAGVQAWLLEVVKVLKAGTDPKALLEFVEWALANPEQAAKL